MDTQAEILGKLEMPGLEFEDSTHTYTLDGVEIPSVSALMKPLNDSKYSRVDEQTLAKAASRGTAIHDAIEIWIKYRFTDIPPDYQSYFDAFMDWWEDRRPTPIASELRMYHKTARYGGTCDLLCYIDGELTLVDYKSTYTVSDMTCGVQLEGYAQALASHGVEVQGKRILHLKKDGKYDDSHMYPAKDLFHLNGFNLLLKKRQIDLEIQKYISDSKSH